MTDTGTVRTSKRKGLANSALGTRNLMIIAALAVVGSLIVVPLTYFGLAWSVTPGGILLSVSMMGLWIIPYLLPLVVVRRPGAALIAGLIMGVISAFTTPQGPTTILGNVIGALLVEIPLLLLLYRKWTWWAYALCGLLFGGFNGGAYTTFQGVQTSVGMQIAIVVTSLISAQVGVWVCIGIRKALVRAGVAVTAN